MSKELSKRRELTHQEKRAAKLWVEHIDVDGESVITKADIARKCGFTMSQLNVLFNRPEFLDEVGALLPQHKLKQGIVITLATEKAVNRLIKIVDEGEDREALQAAGKLLSIAGFSEHKTIDVNVNDATGVIRGGFGRELPECGVIDITDEGEEV